MSGTTDGDPLRSEAVDVALLTKQSESDHVGQTKLTIESKEALEEMLKSEDGHKKAKEMIRSSFWPITHPFRKHLWLLLCQYHGLDKHMDEDSYNEQAKEYQASTTKPDIPDFVDSDYQNDYYLNGEGKHQLRRVLHVLGSTYPAITYGPLIYPIASLFLHFYSEPQTYYCLCSLLNAKNVSFIGQTRAMFLSQSYVVMKLTKKFERKAFTSILQVLDDADDVINKVFLDWSKWLFIDLPFHYMVKIMDCYLMEGSKFLYRIALALMLLFTRNEGRSEFIKTEKELGEKISKFCKELKVPVDKLIKTATSIKGLSRKEVAHQIDKSDRYFKEKKIPSPKHGTQGKQGAGLRMPIQYFESEILTKEQMSTLWDWLPSRVTVYKPKVVYSSNEHGSSLTAFYMCVDPWESTVLLVKTTANEVFGAYCSTSWACRNEKDDKGNHKLYFGTGETFLFTLVPEVKRYLWVGVNKDEELPHNCNLFMTANLKMMCVGAGNGQALWLNEGLSTGKTEHCDTFNNEPLCKQQHFECSIIEVVAFQSADE